MKFRNKDQFQQMVIEEAQKLAIKEVINKKKKTKNWAEILRHPIIHVLLGFILSGLVGAGISDYYQNKEKKNLLQEGAFQSIRNFNQSLSLRNIESRHLASALKRHVNRGLLIQKKESYDLAVKNWNINMVSHQYTFREYAKSKNRIFFELNIEEDLVPMLSAIGVCLTEEFDIAIDSTNSLKIDNLICWFKNKSNNEIYITELKNLIKASDDCGYEITDLLFSFVAINLNSTDKYWKENKNKLQNTISNRSTKFLEVKVVSSMNIPENRSVQELWFTPNNHPHPLAELQFESP